MADVESTHKPERSQDLDGATIDTQGDTQGDMTSDTEKQQPADAPVDASNKQAVAAAWGADAPDGGATAWLVVLGAFCVAFCSFGWINTIGIFQEYYQQGPLREYSPSTISWIPSLQVFFMMATGPIIGKLYDSYGPRYLLLVGTIMHVFGLMMASLADQYYSLLLSQGVCSAIGVSAIFQPTIGTIPGWFNKKRGAAYGLVAVGSSIGGVIFPIMISRLIPTVGYGWAMRAAAFMILGLLIIANLTVRARHPPHPVALSKEQMTRPFKEPAFMLVVFGIMFITFGIYVPIDYLPVQAIEQGMSPDLAQYLVAMLNAGSLFGRLLSGIGADKIGRYNSFTSACFVTGVLVLGLWIPASGNSATIAFAVLFGFFSGAYIALIAALVVPLSPPREIGFRTGLVFLFGSIPGLVTSPIAGAILTNYNSWVGLKVFSGVFILAGTVLIMAARITQTGFDFTAVF